MVFRLATERLVLEDLTEDDLANLRRIAQDPVVMRYVLLGLGNDEEVTSFLGRGIEESKREDRMAYVLAIRVPETGDFAGLTFLDIDPVLKSTAEAGLVLDKEFWGRGYASEILRKLLGFGFDTLSLHRIYGKCDELNHTSARVMEKCGLKYEGTLREHVWLRDHWRSSRYFGILAPEYAACHPATQQESSAQSRLQ